VSGSRPPDRSQPIEAGGVRCYDVIHEPTTPSPSDFFDSRSDVFEGYLDHFRARIVEGLVQLPDK